jgi:hypothetical protein
MAKGQMRSNREKKKPKADKTKATGAAANAAPALKGSKTPVTIGKKSS